VKFVHINDVVYGYASGDPSAIGGSERYQWLVARALASSGWTVTVGVHRALEPGRRRKIDGVTFVSIGNGDGLHSLLSWSRFLVAERPDWWLWQCSDHWLGAAFTVAKLAGVKTKFSAMNDRDVQIRHAPI